MDWRKFNLLSAIWRLSGVLLLGGRRFDILTFHLLRSLWRLSWDLMLGWT